MSDLFEQQQRVVATLQQRIVAGGLNLQTGCVKDLVVALGCAIDKLSQLDPVMVDFARRMHSPDKRGEA